MNKSAILHIPLSQYAYAEDEHTLVIRLRSGKEDIKKCTLFYGDRVDPNQVIRMKELPMQLVTTDDLFDYYEAVIQDIYTRICYYFLLDDGTSQEYYYERNFCKKIDCSRTEYFQFPYIRREDIIIMPDWAESIVMYHIFPDSFASGERMLSGNGKKVRLENGMESVTKLGGMLSGVIDNLEYLEELGVNCLYLNPIFLANSYHKYDTIDYYQIDPCLGTKEDLIELVHKSHEKGIRVILDGVFNHCGSDFFAFQDVMQNGKASKYYDWFYYMPEPVCFQDPPNYEAFAYVKEMPKLNTGNHQVAEYFCNVGKYWIKEADIDGWRLDVANEINHDFWRLFRKEVKTIKPDAFLIGEIWEDAGEWLRGDQFDSTMNYTFSYLCKDFFAENKMTASEFDAQIQRMIMRYPRMVSQVQMNFLDSHDVPRFLSYCNGNRQKLKLAFFYLFTSIGIPSIFYGDENYLFGVTEPEYRQAMTWEQQKDDTCFEDFKKWIQLRKEHKALQSGTYKKAFCDDVHNVYGFLRETKEETILVVINNQDQEYEIPKFVCQEFIKGSSNADYVIFAMSNIVVNCGTGCLL